MASVLNYQIGKGIVSIGGVDVGNVSKFEFMPVIKTLPHYTSRAGISQKDLEVVTTAEAKLSLTMDEITLTNLQIAVLGTAGNILDALWVNVVIGIVGTNTVGLKFQWTFPLSRVYPAKAISLIGDKWNEITVEAEVFADPNSQSFGTIVGL